MKRLAVAIVLIGGCTYTEEQYEEDYLDVFCNWVVECDVDYDSVDSCEKAIQENWDRLVEGCEFVPRDARHCMREMRAMECPADGEEPVWPDVCDGDYVCPDPQ